MKKQQFARAHDVTQYTAELVRAPRRMLPSASAAKYLRNEKGAYDPALSPMMKEPLDHLGKREYTGIVFVGPARSSKTFSLILGGITYIVTCSPGDTLVVQMTSESARDFSRGDLDRSIRHSPELLSRMSPRARDDNTFDKYWRSGISLKLGWPAVSQLSSKTLQYVFLTDYDRPECRDNVDGEGPMWDLAQKRIETYMSRGKCLAESSPGEELTEPNWRPATKHEAPPVPGILSLYNRGTRARWYWPCMHCGFFFEAEPGIKLFKLPEFKECIELVRKNDPMSLADKFAFVACPDCGAMHEMKDRPGMNERGLWVHEGQKIISGHVTGNARRSNIVSYWLGGVAATYQRWDSLLLKWFQGVLTYARSGDEEPLKAVTMTDLSEPYLRQNAKRRRGPETLIERAEEWEAGHVPEGVCFLTAAIDVQSNRFAVSVMGWGSGLQNWLVDRYDIGVSKTRTEVGDRFASLDPASYVEDWDCLIDDVIKRQYPMVVNPKLFMQIQCVLCDSGGRDGVTMRAYEFWRKIRNLNLDRQFVLVKGDGRLTAPRTRQAFPDTRDRKDRNAGARGDVPVWFLNVNMLKDGISTDILREDKGPGYVHFPKWIGDDYYSELTAEVRGAKGWEKQGNARNEAFDLHVYNRAACIMLNAENINWDMPPAWAIPPSAVTIVDSAARLKTISDLSKALNG